MDKKALNMLLGLHVGDALGATLEFKKPSRVNQFHTEITGGGIFMWEAGDPTDDTDLMIALLKSLVDNDKFVIEDVAKNYVKWYKGNPPDIGIATRIGMEMLKHGVYDRGSADENAQSNGSIMRCAPLAIFHPFDELKEISKNQCMMTHGHENCQKIDYLYLTTLSILLNHEMTEDDVLGHVIDYSNKLELPWFAKQVEGIREVKWGNLKTSGYVFDTFFAGLWALINCDSFEEALIYIVNRGDDADTCGAVAGALCGAYYGNIPKKWLTTIKERGTITQLMGKYYGKTS